MTSIYAAKQALLSQAPTLDEITLNYAAEVVATSRTTEEVAELPSLLASVLVECGAFASEASASAAVDSVIAALSLKGSATEASPALEVLAAPVVVEKVSRKERRRKAREAGLTASSSSSSSSGDEASAAPSTTMSKYSVRLEDGAVSLADYKAMEKNTNDPEETLEEFLAKTAVESPAARLVALRDLCPCHVRADIDEFWARIVEMTRDPDAKVRYQALHNLCDGSPRHREAQVIAALEYLHDDEDKIIARRVRKILSHYRRTGDWNVM